MKKEQEIIAQWKLIHRIYNDKKGMFDWEYLKSAIELLIDMERIKMNPYYFDSKE